jgi:hypothetical protein
MLDNSEQLEQVIEAMKRRRVEFAIFDVFNVVHAADENDKTEMRAVLRQLSHVQSEVGCGIGVVHHYSKSETGSMTQRLRGASAIAGWAEWLIGITVADDERRIRRMEFELKAGQPPEPICFQIDSNSPGVVCLTVGEYEKSAHSTARSRNRALALIEV